MSAKHKHMLMGLAAGMLLIKLGRDGLFGETIETYANDVTNYPIIEGIKF